MKLDFPFSFSNRSFLEEQSSETFGTKIIFTDRGVCHNISSARMGARFKRSSASRVAVYISLSPHRHLPWHPQSIKYFPCDTIWLNCNQISEYMPKQKRQAKPCVREFSHSCLYHFLLSFSFICIIKPNQTDGALLILERQGNIFGYFLHSVLSSLVPYRIKMAAWNKHRGAHPQSIHIHMGGWGKEHN